MVLEVGNTETESPLVFLSYASPDRDRVTEFYDYLTQEGFKVWLDAKDLKPGQSWDFEIRLALSRASLVIVFISDSSIDRRGYVQREIRLALDKLQEKVAGDVYIIPILLDQTAKVPSEISSLQVVSADDDDCKERVADAIRRAIEEAGVEIARVQDTSKVSWTKSKYKDAWDGLPGYRVQFDQYRLGSPYYSQINEINDIVRGRLLCQAASWRDAKFSQNIELFNFGEDVEQRTSWWEATAESPKIKGRVLSLKYSCWWYGAKAAHSNFHFFSYVFLLDPLLIINLQYIFSDQDKALAIIETSARDSLLNKDMDEEGTRLESDWVTTGTTGWDSFSAFSFEDEGIGLLFGAYQVAPYAFGPQQALVPYADLLPLILPEYRAALDLYYSEDPKWNSGNFGSEC